eukprot:1263084-Prymnesium_polylepis.2
MSSVCSAALYMITVFEGFMVISGAVSGNIVLNEKEGHPVTRLSAFSDSIWARSARRAIECRPI